MMCIRLSFTFRPLKRPEYRLNPFRIRFQHGKERPSCRIVRDIFRQRISAQIDISVNRFADGDADGVTIVRGQRGGQQALRIDIVAFNAANPHAAVDWRGGTASVPALAPGRMTAYPSLRKVRPFPV